LILYCLSSKKYPEVREQSCIKYFYVLSASYAAGKGKA